MNNAQILTNQPKDNHLKKVVELFADADEIWLATAFLKTSGLALLLSAIKKHLSKGKIIHIITGQNFALTDPEALLTLHHLFLGKINANLYLDKALSKTNVFHPKLFMFRKGNKVTVISGSANITRGGLCDNQEFSVCFETTSIHPQFINTYNYFKEITSLTQADVVTLMVINRYQQYYEEQKAIRKKQKATPDKTSNDFTFDYSKLKKRLKLYDKRKFDLDAKERAKDYILAKHLLDEIATSPKLTQSRFEEIVDNLVGKAGQYGLWRSGSLLRLRHEVYNCKSEFQDLVRFIRENQAQEAGKVFINAKEYVKKVNGAKMNYVAEMMMTYQPKRFANLNSNPITVLKEEAGVYFKSHSDSYSEDDYQAYCEIVKEICAELGLKNMLEADSFINEVYWELKQENK